MSIIRYRTYNGNTRCKVRNPHFSGRGSFVCGYIPGQDSDSDSDSDSDIHFSIPTYYPNAINDYDGNWYDAVIIGDQVWMASNLRTTHYADGTEIPSRALPVSSAFDQNINNPYYFTTPTRDTNGGLFYNWYAATKSESSTLNPSGIQGVSPNGWHIPSPEEFNSFILYTRETYNDTSGKPFCSLSFYDNGVYGTNLSGFNAVDTGRLSSNGITSSPNSIFFTSYCPSEPPSGELLRKPYTATFLPHAGQGICGTPTIVSSGCSVRCICNLSPTNFATWYYNEYGTYNHQIE